MIALMAAAAVISADPPSPGGMPALMPVYGVSTDAQGVTVNLQPEGCAARKSDFTVAISRAADRPTILIARRNRGDAPVPCKDAPRAAAVTWSYGDLGLRPGQPFSLANPLVMAP